MKKLLINIITIVLIILAVIFVQHKFFPRIETETITVTDTFWKDTTIVEYIPDSIPVPYKVIVYETDTVKMPADSLAIVKSYLELHKDFYSTYFYKDTVQNDSLALAIIDAEISQNKPQKYTLSYFDRIPSIINNTTTIHTQNEFFIGLELGNQELSLNGLYKTKKGYIFGIGYDPLNSSFQAKGYINVSKIKLW